MILSSLQGLLVGQGLAPCFHIPATFFSQLYIYISLRILRQIHPKPHPSPSQYLIYTKMSLTFNRPPPLAPSAHLQLPISTLGRELMPQSPPPLSPLNTSPPHSACHSPSQPSSPVTFPSGQAMRGTRAVPAPQLFGPGYTHEMQTPFNTPATPRRNAPILARPCVSRPTSSGGIGTVPSSLSTPLGEARPLNTVSAMRGRGIGIGAVLSSVGGAGVAGRSVGIPSAGVAVSAGDMAHAATPGNTPSSMERISKRMAKNLIHGNQAGGVGGANKIMPSYE